MGSEPHTGFSIRVQLKMDYIKHLDDDMGLKFFLAILSFP